jgi:hypothetical protein
MKSTPTPPASLKVGDVTVLGTVAKAPVFSTSGKTVTITIRKTDGTTTDYRKPAVNNVYVFTEDQPAARCDYQQVDGDPAIRVCVTHDPEFGLYGDEWCAQDNG